MTQLTHASVIALLTCACQVNDYYPGELQYTYRPLGCVGVWEELTTQELEALREEYQPFSRTYTAEPDPDLIDHPDGPVMVETLEVSIHPTFEHGRRFIPYQVISKDHLGRNVICSDLENIRLQVEIRSDVYRSGRCMGELSHYWMGSQVDQLDWEQGQNDCGYSYLDYEEVAPVVEDNPLRELIIDWPRYISRSDRDPGVTLRDVFTGANFEGVTGLIVRDAPRYGISALVQNTRSGDTVMTGVEGGYMTRVDSP